MSIDYTTFDADNHYYEATDAFTRYLDKGMARRTMQWAEIDGRQRLLVAGSVNRFIPNPTFDPVARPDMPLPWLQATVVLPVESALTLVMRIFSGVVE